MAPIKRLLTTFTFSLVCLLTGQTDAQSFQSPCPQLFKYDTTTNETDRWYGTLTLVSDSDLLDVWLRLTFDRTSLQLGNWFGQVETSDSKEYHIKKTNYELKANVPQQFRFFLKYNPAVPAPRLLSFRLNGKLVCPVDTLMEYTFPNRALTLTELETVNTQSSTNSQDRFNTNIQNGLNTQSVTNSRDKLDSQFNTNSEKFDSNIRDIQFGTNSREKVNPQPNINARDKGNTQYDIGSRDKFDANSHDSVNTQLSANPRDRVNSELENNSRIGFNTNSRVNTQSVTSSQNTLGTVHQDKVNTNSRDRASTQSSSISRDRLNTQLDNNFHGEVSTQSSTNSRDRINTQLDTNFRGRVTTPSSTNPRDRVNTPFVSNSQNMLGTNHQDRINAQLDSNSRVGVSTQSSTTSRDRVNAQLDTNFHGGVTTPSSTNPRDKVNTAFVSNSQNMLGTNHQDRVNTQLDSDSGVGLSTQSSTNTRDRNTQLNTNSRDRVNPQPNTNSRERINTQLDSSFSSRETANTQLGTNSRDSSIIATRNNAIRDDICGTVIPKPRPLIAYGEITHEGEFPWHSALYLAKNTMLTYLCGASLISKNFIITAAHCVIKKTAQQSLKPDELIIQLGKYNLKRFSEGYQDRSVSKIIPHPQFNAENYQNDIALLKLGTPATITDYVRPVCLWQESAHISAVLNKIGKVVGWGYDETGKISEELMQAKMPVVPKDKCISSYPDFYTRFTSANSYCAGFANGTSPCNGDAGGGMVFPIPNSNRNNPVWQLRGLISILPAFENQMLCDVTHYTIFTDVARYLDWIAGLMK